VYKFRLFSYPLILYIHLFINGLYTMLQIDWKSKYGTQRHYSMIEMLFYVNVNNGFTFLSIIYLKSKCYLLKQHQYLSNLSLLF